ncbi:hypothetical protein DFJ73DRAFT_841354 [Zopfochytrium polystomum]|nr:hypothetical protein DFJ73DRAFT_841354 [Zopfochytrium polystomum]
MGNAVSSTVSSDLARERSSWVVQTASHRNVAEINYSIANSVCFNRFTRISLCSQPRTHGSFSYDHFFIQLEVASTNTTTTTTTIASTATTTAAITATTDATATSSDTSNAITLSSSSSSVQQQPDRWPPSQAAPYLATASEIVEFDGADFETAIVILHSRPKFGPVIVHRLFEVTTDEDRLPFQQRIIEVIGFRDYSLFLRNCEHVASYIALKSWHSWQTENGGTLHGLMVKTLTEDVGRSANMVPSILRWLPEQEELLLPDLRALLHEDIAKRAAAKRAEAAAVQSLQDLIGSKNFKFTYKSSDTDGRQIKPTTKVILFLGPTGAGKSRIINLLLGFPAAESKTSAVSVTRTVNFYYAVLNGDTIKNMDYCFIDTVGLCDSVLTDNDVLGIVKFRLRNTIAAVDRVVFVINQRLEKPQIDAISSYVAWLHLKKYRDCVDFIMTRCEGMKPETKAALVESLESVSIYKDLKYAREVTVFGGGEKVAVSNICTVGFPNPDDYAPEVVRSWELSFKESYNSLMSAILTMPNERVVIRQEILEKFCTLL